MRTTTSKSRRITPISSTSSGSWRGCCSSIALLSPAVAAQLGLMQAALAIDDGKGAATPQPQNFLEVVPLIAGEFQLLSAAG